MSQLETLFGPMAGGSFQTGNGVNTITFVGPPPPGTPTPSVLLPAGKSLSVKMSTVAVFLNTLDAPAPIGFVKNAAGLLVIQPPSGTIPAGFTGLFTPAPDAPIPLAAGADVVGLYLDATAAGGATSIGAWCHPPAVVGGGAQTIWAWRMIGVTVNAGELRESEESISQIVPPGVPTRVPSPRPGFLKGFALFITGNTFTVASVVISVLVNGVIADTIIVPPGFNGITPVSAAVIPIVKGDLVDFQLDATAGAIPGEKLDASGTVFLSA